MNAKSLEGTECNQVTASSSHRGSTGQTETTLSTLDMSPLGNPEGSPPVRACWILTGPEGRRYKQVLTLRKLRHREARALAPGHKADLRLLETHALNNIAKKIRSEASRLIYGTVERLRQQGAPVPFRRVSGVRAL